MKKTLIISIIVLVVAIVALALCRLIPQKQEFNFKLNYGINAQNSVDTFNNKLTKDLIIDGTKTVDFTIPSDIMEQFKSSFIENNIDKLPSEIINNSGSFVTPSYEIDLTYEYNGKSQTIKDAQANAIWSENVSTSSDEAHFLNFVKPILDYIEQTGILETLPTPNGGYM